MHSAKTRIVTKRSLSNEEMANSREILVTIYGDRIGHKIDLEELGQEAVIGRDADAHITIDDDSVSRQHCKLQRATDGWWVQDLDSTNGTYVAGEMVKRALLLDGDLVKVGSTIFKYLSTANIEAAYYEEIYRMAIFDGLTQIHNRRYFMEFAEREISRCQRHGRPLSLLLFDVDKFKRINDDFGHLSGDHVLRMMASLIKERIRREELFARYAGDEFVVVLPETVASAARKLGQALCDLIAETNFVFDNQDLPVTISVGAAALTDQMHTPAQLVGAADAALYRAKNAGRNTVAI